MSFAIAGYISMPSSEEMSSNPSPVPKDTPATGSYSVVGVIPKPPLRSKSEEETHSLVKAKTESENKPTTNPYVSLVSFEQKSKVCTRISKLQIPRLTIFYNVYNYRITRREHSRHCESSTTWASTSRSNSNSRRLSPRFNSRTNCRGRTYRRASLTLGENRRVSCRRPTSSLRARWPMNLLANLLPR